MQSVRILFDQQGINVLQQRQIVFIQRLGSVFLSDLFDNIQQIFPVELHFHLEKIEKEMFVMFVQTGRNLIEIRFQQMRHGRALTRWTLPNQLRQREEKICIRCRSVGEIDQPALSEEVSNVANRLFQLALRHRRRTIFENEFVRPLLLLEFGKAEELQVVVNGVAHV